MQKGIMRVAVVLSLLGAPALAEEKAAPKPAEQLGQMKIFLGNWKCTGKQLATPMFGPEHTFTASASGKLDIDGFWQTFSYEEKKAKDHPGLKITGLWGYDQGGKRFIRAAGSNHGAWDSASSIGWSGDKMVWTGDLSGPTGRMPFRQTFTRHGDKEWSFRFELNVQGTWTAVSEVSCSVGKK
jgi:hypothetical protein